MCVNIKVGLLVAFHLGVNNRFIGTNNYTIFIKTSTCVSFASSKLSVYLILFVLKCQNKHYFLANECSFLKTKPIVFWERM